MSLPTRALAKLLAGLAALMLLLGACGDDDATPVDSGQDSGDPADDEMSDDEMSDDEMSDDEMSDDEMSDEG